jgi:fluoride exporter
VRVPPASHVAVDEHRPNGDHIDGPAPGRPPEPDEGSRPLRGRPPRAWRAPALVAVGGAVGALARVGLAEAFPVTPDGLPWTTLVENVGGALLLGLLLTLLLERVPASDELRLLVCTGALGAFTTYSTFATELAERLLGGHVAVALVYALGSLMAGLAAAVTGIWLARNGPWAPRRSPAR